MNKLEHKLGIIRYLRGTSLRQTERLTFTLQRKEARTPREVAELKLILSQKSNSS